MIKRFLFGFLLLISGFFFLFNKTKIDDYEDLAVYVNDELVSSIPKKGEAMYVKSVCDNDVKASWDNDTWGLLITNMSKKTKCNLYFYSGDTVFDFDYTGSEQVFAVPVSGTYKLETWGAQGGEANIYAGGSGGYSSGLIYLEKNNVIYINVGGQGNTSGEGALGGYNGGGKASMNTDQSSISRQGSGGGATNISTKSGILSNLENYKSNILMVSGGGGGSNYWPGHGQYKPQYGEGGSAGGFIGNTGTTVCLDYEDACHSPGTGGTQNSGGISYGENIQSGFGIGGTGNSTYVGGAGGGGGFYGGGGSLDNAGGGGGSGYIGNPLLKDKVMYCYNCEESNEEDAKTISTTCSEETPTENCAKKGNGYARITFIGNP